MMDNDYFLGSKHLHQASLAVVALIAAFLRWFRLDNCVLASGDEWLAIGPTFQFLDKFFRNPVTAVGFELAAGFPFLDIGRMGPPFDYTRSLVLIWSMPYYAVVSLFDFPVSESWYRFPGTVWSLLALAATYFFVYHLTRRRVAAFFAFALQATLIGHLVQSRFLVADGVFLFWFALAGGFWMKYLRDGNPRDRMWAYVATFFYVSSTPEAYIGLVSLVSLVVFWLWQNQIIIPYQKPVAALKAVWRVFAARSLWLLVGFYVFQIMVELKFYIHDRDNFLNPANYIGRFWGRGSGELGFFPDRVMEWYIYPHISLPLIIATVLSLLLWRHRKWRAVLGYGWLWVTFWVLLTLVVSNSSSNFTRVMHPFLVLGAAGITAIYDQQRQSGAALATGLTAANIYFVFAYPLLCPIPANQNVAQAVGYVMQEHAEEWGGYDRVGFYFPTGALHAYLPEGEYIFPNFLGDNTFGSCAWELDPASYADADVIFALPDGYPVQDQLNHILIYAVDFDCEAQRITDIEAFVQANDYNLIGEIVADDGTIHANIWARIPFPELGVIDLEDANTLHYEQYSRRGWFSP